jgi:hypothetical protein
MNQAEVEAYNRKEIRQVLRAFKAMDEKATEEAKVQSSALAEFAKSSIVDGAALVSRNQSSSLKIALGIKVSKSSKIGELRIGFASQKYSGGGSTLDLLYGTEFGSYKYKQFPKRSPKEGRGNSGYFIYPTLKKIQPEILEKWETAFNNILKEFD